MRRILGYSLLAIVALLVLALVALATPPGRALVAGMIERGAAGSGVTVSIDSSRGWPPFSLGADKIVLVRRRRAVRRDRRARRRHPHERADRRQPVAFDAIDAERISVLREPHLAGGSGGSSGALLPFAARRREGGAAGTRRRRSPARPAVLALTGSLVSGADGGLAAKVDAERIDGGTATLAATLARADGNAPLAATVDAQGIRRRDPARPDGAAVGPGLRARRQGRPRAAMR